MFYQIPRCIYQPSNVWSNYLIQRKRMLENTKLMLRINCPCEKLNCYMEYSTLGGFLTNLVLCFEKNYYFGILFVKFQDFFNLFQSKTTQPRKVNVKKNGSGIMIEKWGNQIICIINCTSLQALTFGVCRNQLIV